MIERGVVREVRWDLAEVLMTPDTPEACASCDTRGSCTEGPQGRILTVKAPQGTKPGQRVLVETDDGDEASLSAAAVVFLLAAAGIGAVVLSNSNQQVAGQTFPKTTYKPNTVASAFTEQGFVAIPKPKRVVVEEKEDTKAGRRPVRRNAAGKKPAAGGNDAGKGGRKFNFGGDPFGGGSGIVF